MMWTAIECLMQSASNVLARCGLVPRDLIRARHTHERDNNTNDKHRHLHQQIDDIPRAIVGRTGRWNRRRNRLSDAACCHASDEYTTLGVVVSAFPCNDRKLYDPDDTDQHSHEKGHHSCICRAGGVCGGVSAHMQQTGTHNIEYKEHNEWLSQQEDVIIAKPGDIADQYKCRHAPQKNEANALGWCTAVMDTHDHMR
jgi:hypothetical protein